MANNEKYIKLVKDWIKPLQKSLTIETESKFINTLGRQKYFNEYLYNSLTKLENLNLSDEYLKLFDEFSKKYNEYNKLDLNQRKRLIIDTRKSLYKLGKTIEIKSSNPNLLVQLAHLQYHLHFYKLSLHFLLMKYLNQEINLNQLYLKKPF